MNVCKHQDLAPLWLHTYILANLYKGSPLKTKTFQLLISFHSNFTNSSAKCKLHGLILCFLNVCKAFDEMSHWIAILGIGCFVNRDNGLNLKAMDAEQLRENGHKMVDFIADYYKNIENFPVLSQVEVIQCTFLFLFSQFLVEINLALF